MAGGSTALPDQEGLGPWPRITPVGRGCCAGSSGWRVARTVRLGDYQRIAACHRDSAGDGHGSGRYRGAAVGLCAGRGRPPRPVALAAPFRTYAELLGRGGGLAAVAEAHRRSWTSVVAAVPDGAAALVVVTAAGSSQGWCLPAGRRPRVVGAPLGHCDGARVGFGDGRFVSIQFHRAPAELLPGVPRRVGGRGRPVIPLVIPPRCTRHNRASSGGRHVGLEQGGRHKPVSPRRSWVVRFARLMHRRVRAFGPAFGRRRLRRQSQPDLICHTRWRRTLGMARF